jgi:hypothetical protein
VIINLIDTDFLHPLPNNLTELGKKLLDDIAKNTPNSNNELFKKLIEKLDRRKTKETITDIRNRICNDVSGYTINADKFLFLHEWFERQGDLSLRAGEVCQYILNPVAHDDNCLNIMVDNANFYADIINQADTQADEFKKIVANKLSNSTDVNLISFAEKIGIKKDNTSKK